MDLVEHEGLYFYILCRLVRPSSTFAVKEAESAGHSETTDRSTIVRHPVTQLKWKNQNNIYKYVQPSSLLLNYTEYALAQTFR